MIASRTYYNCRSLYVALATIFCTGQDPSDALEFRKDQVDDGVIWKGRNKTNVGAAVAISSILEAELANAPAHDAETLLASSKCCDLQT